MAKGRKPAPKAVPKKKAIQKKEEAVAAEIIQEPLDAATGKILPMPVSVEMLPRRCRVLARGHGQPDPIHRA